MSVPERLVTIQQASDLLNVSIVSLHGTNGNKYQKFRRKVKGSRVIMFDVDGYSHYQYLKSQLTEKTKLFVEYLLHEESINYRKQSEIADVDFQTIYTFSFGYKFALKFMKAFSKKEPYMIERFDIFYGWDTTPIQRLKAIT